MSEPQPRRSSGGHRTARRRRRRRSRLLPNLLTLVVVIAAVYGIGHAIFREPEQKTQSPADPEAAQSAFAAQSSVEPTSHYARKEDFYTILVSGVDNNNGGSDTNILLAVDAGAGKIYGVSIPRDTKAEWDGKDRKINAAFASGGIEKMAEVVSHQLGIPVDYTVTVDLKAFVALVDAIGGVDFNVPIDMDYEDPYQDLSIHIPAGMQHLNGEDALKVVRFRSGYASQDIGRMETQQKFLKAVVKQTLRASNLDKVDDFVKIFKKYVKTDLELGELAWLGKEAITIGAENISFSTLPGEWKSPYIYLDPEAILTLVNEHLNPYVEDRVMEDLNIPS